MTDVVSCAQQAPKPGENRDLQGHVDDSVAKGLEDAKTRYRRGKTHLRGITSESPPNHLGITSESPPNHRITSESPRNHLRITSESPNHLGITSGITSNNFSAASHGTTAGVQNLPFPPRLHGLSTWLAIGLGTACQAHSVAMQPWNVWQGRNC